MIQLEKEKSRGQVKDTVRALTGALRERILDDTFQGEVPDAAALAEEAERILRGEPDRHLRRVINATGVVLHTNFGRAVLSKQALKAVTEAGGGYSNLEYDLAQGCRGSRHSHVEEILKKLTGAEAAMMVNNNAAAVLLCLSALCAGKEVIVSRGEEVEIGGAFRVPDIMRQSGASLIEVGTTNRTKPEDYREAVTDNTAAFLKVHTSNYRIVGFTREASVPELSALGKEMEIPVLYDMGSGLFTDLSRYGVDEPVVRKMLEEGADLVLFSGDKLLGGPQGGFAVGRKDLIDRMKKHPLARAVRVDKMTLAAAEATLQTYLDPKRALLDIPALRMITAQEGELKERADRLKDKLQSKLFGRGCLIQTEACTDTVGGGAAPLSALPGYAVTIRPEAEGRGSDDGSTGGPGAPSPEVLEEILRKGRIPVIARVFQDRLWLSLRTISEEEEKLLPELMEQAVR